MKRNAIQSLNLQSNPSNKLTKFCSISLLEMPMMQWRMRREIQLRNHSQKEDRKSSTAVWKTSVGRLLVCLQFWQENCLILYISSDNNLIFYLFRRNKPKAWAYSRSSWKRGCSPILGKEEEIKKSKGRSQRRRIGLGLFQYFEFIYI